MSTGDKRTNFAEKRILGQSRFDETFFQYLRDRFLDVTKRVWSGERGVFGTVSIVADGANAFSLSPVTAELLDGNGEILTLSAALADGITFQNTNGIPYYIGARFVSVPVGVLRNPRNDVINYDTYEDSVGEIADPDSVVENSGTLEFVVDSIFEAGVSHAGRLVTAYLKVPKSDVEVIAIERNLLVVWDGSNNKVTTAGLLGQTPASTNAADYLVIAQGLTVRRNTVLSGVSPYAYIGTVTGAGLGNPPTIFSTLGQNDVSDGINPDLQEAYEAGRLIIPSTAGGGAVKIEASNLLDQFNAIFEINREGSSQQRSVGQVFRTGGDGAHQLSVVPLTVIGSVFQADEPATLGAQPTVNLTRGGSLDGTQVGFNPNTDVIVLRGFATAGTNRVYAAAALGATSVSLNELTGSPFPSPWNPGETGTLTVYRISFRVSTPEFGFTARSVASIAGPNQRVGGRGLLDLYNHAADYIARIWDDSATPKKKIDIGSSGLITIASQSGPMGNSRNAMIELVRMNDTDWAQFMLLARLGDSSSIPIALFNKLVNGSIPGTVTGTLQGSDEISFVGTTLTNHPVSPDFHLALIEGGANEGIWSIYEVTSDTLIKVVDLQGNAPSASWSGTRNVTILEPKMVVAGSAPFIVGGRFLRGLMYHTSNSNGGSSSGPFRILSQDVNEPNSVFEIWNANRIDTVDNDQSKIGLQVDGRGILKLGNDYADVLNQPNAGFEVWAKPLQVGDADIYSSRFRVGRLEVSPGNNRIKPSAANVRYYDWLGFECARQVAAGPRYENARIFDHFNYQGGGLSKHTVHDVIGDKWFFDDDSGNGQVRVGFTGSAESDGVMFLETNALANSEVLFRTGNSWAAKELGVAKRILNLACRFKFAGASDAAALHNVEAEITIRLNSTQKMGFQYIAGAGVANWQSFSETFSPAPLVLSTNRTVATRADLNSNDLGWQVFYFSMDFGIGPNSPTCFAWMTGMPRTELQPMASFSSSAWDGEFNFTVSLKTTDGNAKMALVDWIDGWSSGLHIGDPDGV